MFLTRSFHAFCYAVGAEKALIQAALRVRFSRGKGFISFPSKMAFYCVTWQTIFCIVASVPFFSVPAALLLYLAPEGSD